MSAALLDLDAPVVASATVWMNRCVARIRAMDASITLIEADALARALWDSPICRCATPEDSAARLLASHPLTTRWVG
jgi:hypothetical protein